MPHAPLVGAVAYSQSLLEVANSVKLGKQARTLRQIAGTVRKENLVSLILQELESVISVFLVFFNQRRRPPRRVQVARWGGRKRTRENPLAKIKAASNPLTVTTTRTGFPTKARPAKVGVLLVRAADLARVPSIARAFATSLVGGQYPPTCEKTVQQHQIKFL